MRWAGGPGVRTLLVVGLALAALVIAGGSAAGAMWLRMAVLPAEPIAGRPAHVAVRTLAMFGGTCVNDPAADARPWWDWNGNGGRDLRFELKAFQGDRTIDIPLTRRASDLSYWDGSVTFPTSGDWTLRMVSPLWSGGMTAGEECAGSRLTVLVRSSPSLPSTATDTLGPTMHLAVVPLAIGALVLFRFGLRRSPRPRHRGRVSGTTLKELGGQPRSRRVNDPRAISIISRAQSLVYTRLSRRLSGPLPSGGLDSKEAVTTEPSPCGSIRTS